MITRQLSRLKRFLVGAPLSSQMAYHQCLPKWKALPVLSSDALSSVAYATEEIFIPLSLFSIASMAWSLPIAGAIVALLFIITISYRQTIESYPNGGGAYTVVQENLGIYPGLVAGASLLIDYTLTVAVSVASGTDNLVAAVPFLGEYRLLIGAMIILGITILHLRGLNESATLLCFPSYFFIVTIFIMILTGAYQVFTGVSPHAPSAEVLTAVPSILLLRAFASGCSALTGIEAISNGVPIFCPPQQRNAKKTLALMSVILATLFVGITLLARHHGIVPTPDQTLVSMLGRVIFGEGAFYYVVQFCTTLILLLAANTSYVDFPRLASLLAKDRYLPRQLAGLGDRLVFSNGIIGLSLVALCLLIFFHGETHKLIPLYAVGVFLSFTLSQAGMVLHHRRNREPGWKMACSWNILGALTTFVVLLVLISTKFLAGAWMVALFIPVLVIGFLKVHQHYLGVGRELSLTEKKPSGKLTALSHTVVVPISGIHIGVIQALRYALTISTDIRVCYVELDTAASARMQAEWKKWAQEIPLVILKSPYRSVLSPLLGYLDEVEQKSKSDLITVVIPEFITLKWRHRLLHNQTAFLIRAALLFKPNHIVTSVRYHLKST